MTAVDNTQQHTQQNIAQTLSNGADNVDRSLNNATKKHPNAWRITKKVASIALPIISVFILPISTILGFTTGAIFHKQVENLGSKVKKWFDHASPLKKGLAITGMICGSILAPSLLGLSIGATTGSKFGNYMNNIGPKTNRSL